MNILLDNPGRVCQELEAITALAAEVDWLTVKDWGIKNITDLCLNVDLYSHGEVYSVRLIFPELFPSIPAIVAPKDGQSWPTEHQYGQSGALCLEFGPDNWQPSYTGADVLKSAYKLLSSVTGPFENRKPVQSRHQLAIGQTFRNKFARYILVDDVLSKLLEAKAGLLLPLSVGVNVKSDAIIVLIGLVKNEDDSTNRLIDKIKEADQGSCRLWINGWAIADNELPSLSSKLTFENLENHLRSRDLWPLTEQQTEKYSLVLLGNSTRIPRCFLIYQSDAPSVIEMEQLEFSDSELRLPPVLKELKYKKIAIIGLGSVGSKMAVSLARSGVENFLLLDDDILAPHNLVRNQLDWDNVGLHKADAVACVIKKVNPNAQVSVRRFLIGGQENSALASGILNMIGQHDLIVDATANKNVFSLLSAVTEKNKKILVWGELFAGGYGGLIARSRAGIELSPLNIRQHLNEYFDTLPVAPISHATSYNTIYNNEVMIASDADVTILSGYLSQFVLDSLLSPEKSEFPVSAYLLGFRKGWIFSSPFDTIPIECPCAEKEPAITHQDIDLSILEGIFKDVLKDLDDNTQSST